VLSFLLAFMLAAPAAPQTLTAVVTPGVPFRIAFDHDGVAIDGFRWWCGGQILKNFKLSELETVTRSDAPTMKTFAGTVPGLPAGRHTCHVTAFNAAMDSDPSVSIEPIAAVKPPAPVDLKIVVTVVVK
jgi:hypothetical protein